MKTTITEDQFVQQFTEFRPDNFSFKGLRALFREINELEQETGVEYEFDPISLCCEFTEYEDIDEFHQDYNKEEYETMDDIRDNTWVIYVDEKAFIIRDF